MPHPIQPMDLADNARAQQVLNRLQIRILLHGAHPAQPGPDATKLPLVFIDKQIEWSWTEIAPCWEDKKEEE